MDIIVMIPTSKTAEAALISRQRGAIAAGGGSAVADFRRFPANCALTVTCGERVYYIEDDYIRGFALISRVVLSQRGYGCQATGCWSPPGIYLFMDATTWRWIRPIPMMGFQGFRYAHECFERDDIEPDEIEIIGSWPEVCPPPEETARPSDDNTGDFPCAQTQ